MWSLDFRTGTYHVVPFFFSLEAVSRLAGGGLGCGFPSTVVRVSQTGTPFGSVLSARFAGDIARTGINYHLGQGSCP
jgi:hypothetical protein